MPVRTGRPKALLAVSDEARETLERSARRPTTAQALAQRARIVLSCAPGQSNDRVAAALGVTRQTVGRWRHRCLGRDRGGRWGAPRAEEGRPGRALSRQDQFQALAAAART